MSSPPERESSSQTDGTTTDGPTLGVVERSTSWRLPERMTDAGARKWYLGSVWGLVYLAIPVALAWVNMPAPAAALTTALLAVVGAVYFVLPPVIWGRGILVATVALLVFVALTCAAFPLLGAFTVWLWIYVPVMVAMSWQPRWYFAVTLAIILLAQGAVLAATTNLVESGYAIALTASIGIMMFAFSQQIQATARLQEAQGEVARLAVVEERERFARDMNDVLGHTLTVVTVKSELARKLVATEPERAETELGDIERMTRSALADLRSAVAGYREMSLDTELAAAQAALTAARITPHLPTSAAVVEPGLRELFAWVLREAVTNVIRHSRATHCWVAIDRRSLAIGDDGRGGAAEHPPAGSPDAARRQGVVGSGLDGLARRAEQAGATFTVEPGAEGGTTLTVRGGRT